MSCRLGVGCRVVSCRVVSPGGKGRVSVSPGEFISDNYECEPTQELVLLLKLSANTLVLIVRVSVAKMLLSKRLDAQAQTSLERLLPHRDVIIALLWKVKLNHNLSFVDSTEPLLSLPRRDQHILDVIKIQNL